MEKEINVLSLFDGHSGAMISLEAAAFKVGKYFASEIDKYSQKVSDSCYPEIIRIGDIRNVSIGMLNGIIPDIVFSGSPCQSFSFAGKRKGMATKCDIEILNIEHYLKLKSENFEFEGQSYLFWEYIRVLEEVRTINPNVYFFLENVEMGEKWEKVLNKAIGVNGIHVNSALVSAQNRRRIYWTNIGMQPGGLFGEMESIIEQPKDRGILLRDILENEVDEKYYLSEKAIKFIHGENRLEKKHSQIDGEKRNTLLARQYASWNGQFTQCVAMRGRGENNEQQLEPRHDNKTNAITSVQKDNLIICHNTMPRSSKTGKGGTVPLSRSDGKTYCLDTGQTNAIEVVKREVIQLNPSKESGGVQPYQQNRVYSIHGLSPCLDTDSGRKNIEILEAYPKLQKAEGKSSLLYHRKGFCKNTQVFGLDGKCNALDTAQGGGREKHVLTSRIRRLTPRECARLQTIPEHIADKMLNSGVSDSQLYKMLGNGWNIETIVHFLKYMK